MASATSSSSGRVSSSSVRLAKMSRPRWRTCSSAPCRRARVPRSQFCGRNSGTTCPSALTMTALAAREVAAPRSRRRHCSQRSSYASRERSNRTWLLPPWQRPSHRTTARCRALSASKPIRFNRDFASEPSRYLRCARLRRPFGWRARLPAAAGGAARAAAAPVDPTARQPKCRDSAGRMGACV